MALPNSDSIFLRALAYAITSRRERGPAAETYSPLEQAIETADLLDALGLADRDVLAAVVVRPLVRDGTSSASGIGRVFGARVRSLVEELSAPRQLDERGRLEWLLQRLPAASGSARAIQLATAVVTVRRMPPAWTPAQRAHYVHWVARLRAQTVGTDCPFDGHVREALRLARSAPLTPRAAPPPAAPEPPATKDTHLPPELLHELRRVRGVVARVEERLGDVIDGLDGRTTLPAWRVPDRAAAKRARKYATPGAREQATHGVGSVALRTKDARSVLVSLDGGREFCLSPVLAHLLEVIASRVGAAEDGFVAFQPIDAVMSALLARGHRSSRRAVIVGISRLRGRLAALHYPPLLVETSVHGVRFRVRVAATVSDAGDRSS